MSDNTNGTRETWREAMIKGVYAQVDGFSFFPSGETVTEDVGATMTRVFLYALVYCAGLGRQQVVSPIEIGRAWATSGLELDGSEDVIIGTALDLVRASFTDPRDAREALRLGAKWLAAHWDSLDEREARP